MNIVITDSGVGGLSVCAFAERFLRSQGFGEPVKLTFVNAALANDFGYNSMGSRDEKLETFDRFLHRLTDRYAPDRIYVACNTLSVLMQDTPYVRTAAIPVKGIVETAVGLLLDDLGRHPDRVVLIFGTVTTIEAGTYQRMLAQRGVGEDRIVAQACPGLADTISEDREGSKAAAGIGKYVRAAIERMETPAASCLAFLACTHYGYRSELFSAAFREAGIRAEVLDPNEHAVGDVFGRAGADFEARRSACEVEVVSRYRIPDATIETVTHFLGGISPRTVRALQNFTHIPDLF